MITHKLTIYVSQNKSKCLSSKIDELNNRSEFVYNSIIPHKCKQVRRSNGAARVLWIASALLVRQLGFD